MLDQIEGESEQRIEKTVDFCFFLREMAMYEEAYKLAQEALSVTKKKFRRCDRLTGLVQLALADSRSGLLTTFNVAQRRKMLEEAVERSFEACCVSL